MFVVYMLTFVPSLYDTVLQYFDQCISIVNGVHALSLKPALHNYVVYCSKVLSKYCSCIDFVANDRIQSL